MQLADLTPDITTFLYADRYVNDGSRRYSRFADQSDVTPWLQPQALTESFLVPTLEIPRSQLAIITDSPAPDISRYYGNDSILFPIHPDVWTSDDARVRDLHCRYKVGPNLVVIPTASTRTVYVLPTATVPAHFLKLHLPKRISRFNRRLHYPTIVDSVAVSQALDLGSSTSWAYLPETIGISLGTQAEDWGFIVRESVPRPQPKPVRLLPYFSLYATDLRRPGDLPLLIQLVERADIDPVKFVTQAILFPVVRLWLTVAGQRGILLEPHGQNILLELDAVYRPTRVVYRDLDVYVDDGARARASLPDPFCSFRLEKDAGLEAGQVYSLLYDTYIGHHLFDPIARLIEQTYHIPSAILQEQVRAYFQSFQPNDLVVWPTGTYGYSDELLSNNRFRIVQQEPVARWR